MPVVVVVVVTAMHSFDAHGVVLVYNPEQEGQVSESGAWYEYFVQNNDLPDEACVVFAFAPNAQRGTRQRVSPKIEHLNVVNISLDDGSLVKTQFERFLKAAKARKDAGGGGGEAWGRSKSGYLLVSTMNKRTSAWSGRMEHWTGERGGDCARRKREDDCTRRGT